MKIFLLLLCGVSFCLCTEAEIVADSIEVTARVIDKEPLSGSEGYRYLSLDEKRGETSLSELLSTVPGVSVRHGAGVGGFEKVSIRGVSGGRVTVFLDGVELQSAMGGAVDLSRFSMENLEGVEIYKGITPARFGGNSLGGVINLISKENHRKKRRDVSLLVGSFSEFRASGSITESIQKSVLNGFIEYHSGDNDYPYLDRNTTPHNSHDDTMVTLVNNRSVMFNSSVGLSGDIPIGTYSVNWSHREKQMGIPAAEGFINRTAETKEGEDRLKAVLNHTPGSLTLSHSLSFIHNRNSVFWTGLDNFGSVHGVLKGDDWGELKSTNVKGEYRCNYSFPAAKILHIAGSVSASYEEMVPSTDVTGFGNGEWNSSRVTGANATDFTVTPGAFSTTLGGSLTGHYSKTEGGEDPYTGFVLKEQSNTDVDWSARIGFSLSLIDRISLFANAALYERVPSLRELYGYHGGVLANPELDQESGRTVEVGISYMEKAISEVTFFANHFNELISMIYDGRVARAVNLGENRSFGIEQTLFWQIVPTVSVREAITLQKTENLTKPFYEGKLLPNQAPFTLFTDLTVGPFAGVSLTSQYKFESLLFRDFANLHPFPAVEGAKGNSELSFFLKWQRHWFTLSGSIRNVLEKREHDDSRYTLESGFYSTLYPGRVWQIEMKCNF